MRDIYLHQNIAKYRENNNCIYIPYYHNTTYGMMANWPLESEGWFYPGLTRARAEKTLKTRGEDGSFLVRECENPKGVYVMSYRTSGFIFHTKIDNSNNKYRIAGGREFHSMSKLVEYYIGKDGALTTDAGATVKLCSPLYQTDLTQISWYHSQIDSDEAKSRLMSTDAADGSFLVRDSGAGGTRPLTLCVRRGQGVAEICVNCQEADKTYQYSIGTSTYPTLPQLVEHCCRVPPGDGGGGTVPIGKPLSKPDKTSDIRSHNNHTPSPPPPEHSTDSPDAMDNHTPPSSPKIELRRSRRLPSVPESSDSTPQMEKDRAGSVDSLENAPLYQVYHRSVVTRDIVEQVEIAQHHTHQHNGSASSHHDDLRLMDEASLKRHVSNIIRQSKMVGSPVGQAGHRQSCLFDVLKYGMGQLNLWRNIPEVQRSGVLSTMDQKAKRLQESLYEIITSEASYLKSVHVLIDHFYNNPVFKCDGDSSTLSKQNHRFLFSNIKKVEEISKGFLQKLRILKKKSYVMDPAEIATAILEYAKEHFDVYVVYAKNQAYQERALSELREKYPVFNQGVTSLERHPKAQGLPFQSFLLLPVQRITRMPLLLDSVLSGMDPTHTGFDNLKECFCYLQKIVIRCNEEAKQMADIEQVAKISEMLDFKKAKKVPLVSQHRCLIREGTVTNLGPHFFDAPARKPFQIYLFLFNDILVITKRKGAGSFEVLENAPVAGITVDILNEDDVSEHLPQGIPSSYSDLFLLNITEKKVKCVLSCDSISHQMRWVEALTPPTSEAPTVKLFSENDCPQAQAIQPYIAQQPDELSLDEADIVSVTMKLGDGWWQGQRLHDNQKGWFPSSVVVEIQSAHMRERNRRQQYRLLFGYNRLSNEFIC